MCVSRGIEPSHVPAKRPRMMLYSGADGLLRLGFLWPCTLGFCLTLLDLCIHHRCIVQIGTDFIHALPIHKFVE